MDFSILARFKSEFLSKRWENWTRIKDSQKIGSVFNERAWMEWKPLENLWNGREIMITFLLIYDILWYNWVSIVHVKKEDAPWELL